MWIVVVPTASIVSGDQHNIAFKRPLGYYFADPAYTFCKSVLFTLQAVNHKANTRSAIEAIQLRTITRRRGSAAIDRGPVDYSGAQLVCRQQQQ